MATEPEKKGPRGYEFDDHENNTFMDLASAMRAVGRLLLVIGPIRVVMGLISAWKAEYAGGAAQVVEGACFFLIGNWTNSAAMAYDRIVESEGDDIRHLMSSMVDLKKIYSLQRTVLSIALAAIALGGVVLVLSAFGDSTPKVAKAPPAEPVAPPPPAAAVPAPVPAPLAAPVPAAPPPPVAAPAPAEPTAAAAPTTAKAGKHGKVKKVRKTAKKKRRR